MYNVLKIGVFTIFTALIVTFSTSGESHAKPGLYEEGPDGRIIGHVVSAGGQKKYISLVPKSKTRYNLDKVAGKTIGGGVIGAGLAPFSAGTSVPVAAGLGAAGGALWESWDWAWENRGRLIQDTTEQVGKIAKVEDPMGRSFPH